MPNKKRFEEFIETIIKEGDGEYADGSPMTEDAKAFLKQHKQMVTAWETILTMSEKGPVVLEPKRR